MFSCFCLFVSNHGISVWWSLYWSMMMMMMMMGKRKRRPKKNRFSIVSEYIYDDFSGETVYSQAFFAILCIPVSDNHVMSTTVRPKKNDKLWKWEMSCEKWRETVGNFQNILFGRWKRLETIAAGRPSPSTRHDSQAQCPHPQWR